MKTNCIVTKFYIGQELYLVEKVEKERDCGVCKGTGKIGRASCRERVLRLV